MKVEICLQQKEEGYWIIDNLDSQHNGYSFGQGKLKSYTDYRFTHVTHCALERNS